MEHRTGVDTLSLAERISVRTNAADWLLLTPNIGVEYDIRNTNWNRWSVGVNLRGNWQSSHTYKPGAVYNLLETKLEVRNYRRTRQKNYTDSIYNKDKELVQVVMETNGLNPHRWWTARLLSPRRKNIKFPMNTYYRGVYLSHANYSIMLGRGGKQGSALSLGMSYGIIRPLHVYKDGSSLDFEMGISGGLVYTKYDKYKHDSGSNCYPVIGKKDWHIVPYPVVTEVRVGFVYRFGKYPITSKYRWRYDVDTAYQNKLREAEMLKNKIRMDKETDKKEAAKRRIFVKDSIKKAKLKLQKADSIRNIFKKDSLQKAKIAKSIRDSIRKDSIRLAKIEKKRLEELEKAKQDSIKAVERKEKELKKEEEKNKGKDKAKKGKDEEQAQIDANAWEQKRLLAVIDERRRHE